ncbi:hypothetical protein DMH25_20465 [Streptomyces sp. WAC 01325]|uniref:WXG100 family type VII secretion target n=2 Tax=Streptomyces TaxID=1883 RepID=A0A7H8TL14_STRCX|nr:MULTISPECIES: hypothetical protein [Streptomyces]MCZ4609075.1 hypothetical protein [Streptomyces sp. Lzd4kr]QWA20541.1 hypothetical protein KJK32_02120 [Streptomyces sp. JCM17656]MBT1094541.1 hypothetical protein [Streptomyces sp. Tu102]QEV72564.1 hypothetical protein CP983_41940 [Streptomyces chartreusis]QKZ24213.1 hypothetical protein HUT05_46845 [Streptomyces chartreusis]
MGQRYYVDPNRIEALARQLEEIGTLAKGITEEFLDDLAPTVSWPGTEGDFAEKAKPQEQKERQTTKETMMSIRDAVVGITDATVSQVRMMKDTRDRNIEDVERVNNRIETDGLNGDGPGGHGRR